MGRLVDVKMLRGSEKKCFKYLKEETCMLIVDVKFLTFPSNLKKYPRRPLEIYTSDRRAEYRN